MLYEFVIAVFTSGMDFDYDTIAARVRERAFLVPGVKNCYLDYFTLLFFFPILTFWYSPFVCFEK